MAESDWTELTGVLAPASAVRAVTAGITPPNGGGSFIHGCNTLVNTSGMVGRFVNQTGFAPASKGGDVRGAMQRGVSTGNTGMSCFLWLCSGGADVSDQSYMLGLTDGDPAHIALVKGIMQNGLVDDAPGSSGVLARSTETIAVGTWVHLRLEAVVNASGDVVLNCYQNDLDTNAVTAPVWEKIPGMSDFSGGIDATAFIDDALGVNSGSLPFTSGRLGFGRVMSAQSRRTYFDHLEVQRQL
jgi:hypothetical protein